jgi:pyridoxal phosphate enzyme (YggS family)
VAALRPAALSAARVRENLARVRSQIAAAAQRSGRDPAEVTILAATKYIEIDQIEVLLSAGLRCFGENRAAELVAKASRYGDRARFDFIGRLQSRKVREIAPYVQLIHSVASESALRALRAHPPRAQAGILIQVNIAGEPGKAGIDPKALPALMKSAPCPVLGLMTMPPASADPQSSRVHFRALRELAYAHGLSELSMGTSQDYPVAVEEGATIVRIGTTLYV